MHASGEGPGPGGLVTSHPDRPCLTIRAEVRLRTTGSQVELRRHPTAEEAVRHNMPAPSKPCTTTVGSSLSNHCRGHQPRRIARDGTGGSGR